MIKEGIKNIVLDLGGVIVNLDMEGTIRRLMEVGITLQQEEMIGLIHQMDRGKLTGNDFAEYVAKHCRKGTTAEQIKEIYYKFIITPQCRLQWIKNLRQHYRVLLLSNIGDLHWDYFQRTCQQFGLPVSELFDETYLSYQMRTAKPDPLIFERLLALSGIHPEESFYIDDNADNIRTGASFGLQTHLIPANSWNSEKAIW